MSKYTTEVRYICENAIGLKESTSNAYAVIRQATPIIFNFTFPIFDEQYRELLENKILAHYYLREIGAETVGLWKFFLQRKLNEIMPYYNQLYKSELLVFNPLYDTDLSKKYTLKKDDNTNNIKTFNEKYNLTQEVNANTHATNETNTHSLTKNSDTPQGGLNGVIDTDYLSSAQENNTDSNSTDNADTNTDTEATTNRDYTDILNGNFTANDKYAEKIIGKSAGKSFSELLQEFRNTFLNIDMQVIMELEPLFMQLW